MINSIITYLVTLVLVFIISFIANYIRNRIYKPKYENNVQKPGKFERFIASFLLFLVVFLMLFVILGIFMGELEMTLVFASLALFLFIAALFIKRAHNTSYQENAEYFILKIREKEYQVFYENIIDWQPSYNEIAVLDETRSDQEYIKVNIRIFKPEVLLRKIADMAFDGRFHNLDQTYIEDPYREVETIYYLVDNQYGYLVGDYVKEIENQ